MEIKPTKKHYRKVQIDEQVSFVREQEKKVWNLYAYRNESKEILALTTGKRNKHIIKDLPKCLQGIAIDFYATDGLERLEIGQTYYLISSF